MRKTSTVERTDPEWQIQLKIIERDLAEAVDEYLQEQKLESTREFVSLYDDVQSTGVPAFSIPVEIWQTCILPCLGLRDLRLFSLVSRYCHKLVDFSCIRYSAHQTAALLMLPNLPVVVIEQLCKSNNSAVVNANVNMSYWGRSCNWMNRADVNAGGARPNRSKVPYSIYRLFQTGQIRVNPCSYALNYPFINSAIKQRNLSLLRRLVDDKKSIENVFGGSQTFYDIMICWTLHQSIVANFWAGIELCLTRFLAMNYGLGLESVLLRVIAFNALECFKRLLKTYDIRCKEIFDDVDLRKKLVFQLFYMRGHTRIIEPFLEFLKEWKGDDASKYLWDMIDYPYNGQLHSNLFPYPSVVSLIWRPVRQECVHLIKENDPKYLLHLVDVLKDYYSGFFDRDIISEIVHELFLIICVAPNEAKYNYKLVYVKVQDLMDNDWLMCPGADIHTDVKIDEFGDEFYSNRQKLGVELWESILDGSPVTFFDSRDVWRASTWLCKRLFILITVLTFAKHDVILTEEIRHELKQLIVRTDLHCLKMAARKLVSHVRDFGLSLM